MSMRSRHGILCLGFMIVGHGGLGRRLEKKLNNNSKSLPLIREHHTIMALLYNISNIICGVACTILLPTLDTAKVNQKVVDLSLKV
jgi:hypothetical protein